MHVALRPSLFLTAGLRWEGQWNPQPPATITSIAPIILPSFGGATSIQSIPNDLKQWQPRVGLAWSPGSKTTLRLSAGLYTALTPAAFFHRIFTDGGDRTYTLDSYFDPTLIALSGGSTASPHALAFAPAGLNNYHAQVVAIDSNFRNPRFLPSRGQHGTAGQRETRPHPGISARQHMGSRTSTR